jgi:hypothetical protein
VKRVVVSVPILVRDGIAHYSGVQTCGSVWACPVCSAKIREARSREIEQAVSGHIAAGGGVAFLTVTVPHDAGMPLASVWSTVQAAWRSTWGGRAGADVKTTLGIVGTIRTLEVTYGRNGWHPHVHALVLTERPLSTGEEADLFLFTLTRWRRFVARQGWPEPSAMHALDYRQVALVNGSTALGAYLAKVRPEDDAPGWGVGREVARADVKASRVPGNLTPFLLASVAMDTGEVWAVRAWQEYERASHGRRAIVWSPGLRDRLGVGTEAMDDELAAQEVGGETVALLAADAFDWLAAQPGDLLLDVLELVEQCPDAAPGVIGAFLVALRAPPRIVRGVAPPPGPTC